MAYHVLKGDGAPTSTPAKLGQHYIDETGDIHYISVGIASSADWTKQAADSDLTAHTDDSSNPHSVTKTQAGLGNADNTSDANKPVSSAAQTALDAKLDDSQKGAANGLAELGSDSKIPSAQLPAIAITDTHVVADETAQLALTVEKGDVAVRTDESKSYIALNSDNADMGDWELLKTPTDAVSSVVGQTGAVSAAQVKTALEGEVDYNNFSDSEQSKLTGIEASAKDDQTGAEIKTAYEAEADTNEFSDSEQTKLAGIESGATADQSGAEIKTAYEGESNTNPFTDAEQTKLTGIATSAEVNPDLISQAEAEAGTDTNERTVSALRIKQAIDALGSGGGLNDINFSYGTTAGDFIELAAIDSYTMIDSFLFQGSTKIGTPTYVRALVSSSGSETYQWRIYDVTNSQVISECTSCELTTARQILSDFGSPANIPTGLAMWELQVKEVPTSASKARCHGLLIGF